MNQHSRWIESAFAENKRPLLVCRLGPKSDMQCEVTVRRTPRWFLLHSNGAKAVMGHKSQRHRGLIASKTGDKIPHIGNS